MESHKALRDSKVGFTVSILPKMKYMKLPIKTLTNSIGKSVASYGGVRGTCGATKNGVFLHISD